MKPANIKKSEYHKNPIIYRDRQKIVKWKNFPRKYPESVPWTFEVGVLLLLFNITWLVNMLYTALHRKRQISTPETQRFPAYNPKIGTGSETYVFPSRLSLKAGAIDY